MTERQMRAFWQFVMAGYSKEGAAALVGNAMQESSDDLISAFQKRADHGSQGIFQWRLERLDDLVRFCQAHGLHAGTLVAQIKFAVYELGKDYTRLDRALRRGGDVADLTAAVCWEYERPAKSAAALERRIKYAKEVLVATQLQSSARGGAITSAGAVSMAIAIYLQHGPVPETIMFLAGGLIIWAVVIGAMHPRKAPPIDEAPPDTATLANELKGAIENFNRAYARLEIAVSAEEAGRTALLAKLPPWAVAALTAKSAGQDRTGKVTPPSSQQGRGQTMLQNALLSWRTSLIGMGPFMIGLGHAIAAIGAGHIPDEPDLVAIAAGLIGFFAKDGTVTGTAAK
jgi:hypothetical protein